MNSEILSYTGILEVELPYIFIKTSKNSAIC